MNQAELSRKVGQFTEPEDPEIVNAVRNIAAAIVDQAVGVQAGQKVLIWFDEPGMGLVKEMQNRCVAKGAPVKFFMRDLEEDAKVVPNLTEEEIRERFALQRELVEGADVVLLVRGAENPEAMRDVPADKKLAYDKCYAEAHRRRINGSVDWNLTLWPTEYEAKKEGMTYRDYLRTCLEAYNCPWGEVDERQEILIEKLDQGKMLQLIVNDPDNPPDRQDPKKITNIRLSIEGMTFANSTIGRNYPGSEVFSAPVLDSVQGVLYAPGDYLYDNKLMRNIHFTIKDGKITEAYAEVGNDGLQEILNKGVGARYFGEIAFGTNRGLTRRFFNELLNEKVSGSFHITPGHCYEYEMYRGKKVNVNNGNTEDRTPVHWDLTILMHRKPDGTGGGQVILDGEVIQEDGMFLDPRLAILNPVFK